MNCWGKMCENWQWGRSQTYLHIANDMLLGNKQLQISLKQEILRENIPAIKDFNGRPITESTEKGQLPKFLLCFCHFCTQSSPQIQSANLGEPFAISVIRKQLTAIGRNKSTGSDGIPKDILKLGREAMILYLAWLLDITINNAAIPGDWKKAIVVPTYNGGDHPAVINNRPVA